MTAEPDHITPNPYLMSPPPTPPEPIIIPRTKRILIVDDDFAMRRLLEVCLGTLAADQVAVNEGKQALEVLHRERIDLVVTDLIMPESGGFDIVREMRKDPALNHIPVVVLSSLGHPEMAGHAHVTGVQAHFTKPFSPAELISTARRLLEL